ncbi:MAG: VWA domain-containing protein [Saprospiraceae bacterium]|nr:VWA domain-containing protein [Saprospiraceae bacterium]
MSNLSDRLEQEYERFIEFGQLLDRQTRKYLVQYLQNLVHDKAYSFPEDLEDHYYSYFRKALDDLFAIEQLLPTLQRNQRISEQVILDTLYWMRKTFDKTRAKNPFEEEESRLQMWSITPMNLFKKRWFVMINYLSQVYNREELNIDFYQSQFDNLIGKTMDSEPLKPEGKEKLERVLTDLLAQWDALLHAKILEHQLQYLEEEINDYLDLMKAKVDEYSQLMSLISPFSDYLGWDMSRSLWEDTSFSILEEYHHLLEQEDSLKELVDLLGRMREAEIQMEEEALEKTIIRQEWVPDETSKAEVVGIHESDDLNQMLSSEAALLGDIRTEDLFLAKFAEKNLLTFKYEDKKLVRSEDQITEMNQRTRLKEKGPFILCIDTSESMLGRPEQIAKVLALGVLKMALQENRKAYLINFSIGIKTIDLYDITDSIDELAKFLRMSFHGGTDISLPLYEAIRQIKGETYQDADVLVISDFIMYRVDREVLKEVKYFQQNQGTQFHSLTLGQAPNAQILQYFDTNWVFDPKDRGIMRELTIGLETLRTRY